MEDLRTKYEKLFEQERNYKEARLNFYKKLYFDMKQKQSIISSICIEKRLEFEFGREDFSNPSKFIEEINTKIMRLRFEIESFDQKDTIDFLLLIEKINKINPKYTMQVTAEYCESVGLCLGDFIRKQNALMLKLKKMKSLGNENAELSYFEAVYNDEKEKLDCQVEVAENFSKNARKDNNNTSNNDYESLYDELQTIYLRVNNKTVNSGNKLTKHQELSIKAEAINIFMKQAAQTFIDNMNITFQQIRSDTIARNLSNGGPILPEETDGTLNNNIQTL